MTPYIEADQNFRYYVNPDKATQSFLSLTSQGLIAVNDGSFGESAEWRFTTQAGADFNGKGVSSNLTSEAATLYRGVKEDASYNRIAVQQNMVVQKSLEQRAKEAADMIFNLRQKRVQIVTGDTDATYSGEAMGAALKEISALEKEYMSMFIGYSDFQTQKLKCDVVPVKNRKSQTYVAFRISDTDGIVSADNMSGKPYLLEIVPQPIGEASGKGAQAKSNGGHLQDSGHLHSPSFRWRDLVPSGQDGHLPARNRGLFPAFKVIRKKYSANIKEYIFTY